MRHKRRVTSGLKGEGKVAKRGAEAPAKADADEAAP